MENPRPDAQPGGRAVTDGEAAALLARARTGLYPPNWYVWPMQSAKVRRGLIRWAIYAVGGFAFFVPALFIMIPDNFSGDGNKAVASLVVLLLLGMMAFGSLYYLVHDMRRLAAADQYLLLMTPDDFVRDVRGKITHVPMDSIANVTLKGVRSPGAQFNTPQSMPTPRMSMSILMMPQRRQVSPSPFRAPLLTFRDTRTKKTIVLTQDDAFDDIRALEEVLSTFVDEKVRARRAAEVARGTTSDAGR
jgi:hypothetical protein